MDAPKPLEVTVVGCGAVGLPLALAFAERGRSVLGVEVDATRLARLASGAIAADPERLDHKLTALLAKANIRFAAEPEPGSGGGACAFVIAVPTPADADGRFVDGPLESATRAIVAVAQAGDLVCIRSTVPIGTLRGLAARRLETLAYPGFTRFELDSPGPGQ